MASLTTALLQNFFANFAQVICRLVCLRLSVWLLCFVKLVNQKYYSNTSGPAHQVFKPYKHELFWCF